MAEHQDRAHAQFSPSSLDRTMSCTASIGLEEQLRSEGKVVDGPNHPRADRGTYCHEIVEILAQKQRGNAKKYIGERKEFSSGVVTFDEVMASEVDEAVKFIRQAKKLFPNMTWEFEVKMDPVETIGSDLWGTCDVVGYSVEDQQIVIIDNKFSIGKYDVTTTKQLRAYALLAGEKYGVDYSANGKAFLAFNQPNVSPKTLTFEYFHVVSGEELRKFEAEVINAMNAAAVLPEFTPSDKACQWCKCKSHCEHYEESKSKELAERFEPVSEEMQAMVNLPVPSAVAPEKVADFIRFKSIFDDRFKELIKLHEGQAISNPDPYTGCKIVKGREGNRKYAVSDAEVVKYLVEILGHKLEDVTSTSLLSVSKLEAVLGKDAVTTLEWMDFITRAAAKPKLALEDDKRKDYDISKLFTPVTIKE